MATCEAPKRLDAAISASRLPPCARLVVEDPLKLLRHLGGATQVSFRDTVPPATAFSIGWALAVLSALVWGVQANRCRVVNVAARLSVIHFCTQWFERLGATSLSVLLGDARALRRFNRAVMVA